jgi:hypothetical protein
LAAGTHSSIISLILPGKNNSRKRFRYGRLSVDSDDQNFNNKPNDADDENMKFGYCQSLEKSQRVDENGNTDVDNVNNNFITGTILLGKDKSDADEKPKKQVEQKINRLQAMAMSDDEDYGEWRGISCVI